MNMLIILAMLSFGFACDNVYAMSVMQEQQGLTTFVAKQILDNQPVLIKDKDNSVGVIVEDINNFPKIPDDNIYESLDDQKKRNNNLLTLPETGKTTQYSVINLNGIATRVALVDFQYTCLGILRSGGIEPKAVFNSDTQVVVTPDGKEKTVSMNIAVWKVD